MAIRRACPKSRIVLSQDGRGRLSGATLGERYGFARTRRDTCCAPAQLLSRLTRRVGTPRHFLMSSRSFAARNLAAAFLAGAWSPDALIRRGAEALGRRGRHLRPLVRRLLAAVGDGNARPEHDALSRWIAAEPTFHKICEELAQVQDTPWLRLFPIVPHMTPTAGASAGWPVPPLPTVAALAAWLGLEDRALHWLADCRGREADAPPGSLRHYTYHRLRKASGAIRMLEAPKARLKAVQRRILHGILDHLPPHESVHSYRRGRSLAGFVAPHAGRGLVLHIDLRDFFPSLRQSRVHALFRTAGYPLAVARLLTGLCTNVAPIDVWRDLENQTSRERLRSPHVPQGAPTSPALANLCAYRLDCRLSALAAAVGAAYTRYADDLAFSGDKALECVARRFHIAVCRMALEEGFEVHTRKTRFMRQGVRQQLAGVVLNVRPNVRRARYDELKAILTNCLRHGPHGQNREGRPDFRGHLRGRIAHVAAIHPARGRRLLRLFEGIAWAESP